jgi:nitroreductase
MNLPKMLNLFLVIALVVLFVVLIINRNRKTGMETPNTNQAIETILSRTSIRSYLDKPVEDEKVELMLKAAMSAPTAVNCQPWAFIVVNNKAVLNQLADSLPHAKMVAKAPLAIVVCGDLSKALEGNAQTYWIQDASAATENLLLAAHGMGLGAVWTGVYPIADRVSAVQKVLNLPDHIIPLNVVPVGYPNEVPNHKDKWNTDNIHYNKW